MALQVDVGERNIKDWKKYWDILHLGLFSFILFGFARGKIMASMKREPDLSELKTASPPRQLGDSQCLFPHL